MAQGLRLHLTFFECVSSTVFPLERLGTHNRSMDRFSPPNAQTDDISDIQRVPLLHSFTNFLNLFNQFAIPEFGLSGPFDLITSL